MSLHCGKCGYNVHGLPTSVCPECGADLDIVGRVQRRTLKQRRVQRAIWFAVLIPVAAIVAMFGLECTVIPGIVEEQAFVILDAPKSGAYRRATVRFYSRNWYFPGTHAANAPWQSCEVRIENGDSHSISVNPRDKTFRMVNGGQQQASATALLRWLAESGVDTSASGVSDEAQVIEELISKANAPNGPFAKKGRRVMASGGTRSSWGHSKYSAAPLVSSGIDASAFADARATYESRMDIVPMVHEFLLIFGIAIWGYGIWRILRSPGAPSGSGRASQAV